MEESDFPATLSYPDLLGPVISSQNSSIKIVDHERAKFQLF
jgi:hypothetical protein